MPLTALTATGLNNAVPFARPLPVPPNANGLLPRLPSAGLLSVVGGSLFLLDLVGKAGGYQWTQDQLAKIGGGNISRSGGASNPLGGQAVGVEYLVQVQVTFSDGETRYHVVTNGIGNFATLQPDSYMLSSGLPLTGSIGSVGLNRYQFNGAYITVNGQDTPSFVASLNIATSIPFSVSIAKIIRRDGQPNTDADKETKLPPVPYGYRPPESPFKTDEDRKVGTPKPLQASRANGLLGALGLASPIPTKSLSPSPVAPVNPNPATTPSPSPPFAPSPSRPPAPNPPPEKEPKKTPPPINPTENKPPDLGTRLRDLGAIIALIAGATTFDNLKNAAKTGSCETLKSPSCTKDMEDRIKNPVNANIDAKTAALAANQAGQDIALGNIIATQVTHTGFFNKILSVLNNTVIDRTLAVMNLATNIHNAALLTRDIGETLGSVVDNVISLTPLRFTNSEGSQVQFTDFVGSNFRTFVISILGAERYVELTLNWQKASMILNSAAQVLNTTQSMLDPISSAVEYGMENVSKIGNSLKEDGVVSENAYPAMDETIRARRVNRFERLNDTLEGAENIASNLSSVTSSAVSIKEDYKQLREDSKDLRDKATAFNTADSEARAALKAELPTEITPITLAPAPAEDEEP